MHALLLLLTLPVILSFMHRTTQQPAGAGVDAMTINMLRKKAELIAARRRAAELNVKLLSSQQPLAQQGGQRTNPSALRSPTQQFAAINRLALSGGEMGMGGFGGGGAPGTGQATADDGAKARDTLEIETRVQAEVKETLSSCSFEFSLRLRS